MTALWTQLAARAAVALSEAQVAQLHRYLDLLIEANQTMNLTRITDRDQAERLHVGDALTLLPYLPAGHCMIADLGSGGGVPGIPLAIARPNARFLLVESTKKKAAFLWQTIEALGLTNVEVSDSRVEDLGHSEQRARYDVVTARAVALMPWLIEWAVPLLKFRGSLLAMKGAKAAEELALSKRAQRMLRASDPVVHPVTDLPGAENYVIVEVRKTGKTEDKYPRSPTLAKGKHL
ncbi:MAG TPA: 16S rRNA (guanine(527)-N(7))-methyltransferase RsmG [Humisphaera sp.]